MIENGLRIKAIGSKRFLLEEKQKWMCAQCGGVISLHDRICSECGEALEPAV
jgi:predicted amidophosphoribosyltransferase